MRYLLACIIIGGTVLFLSPLHLHASGLKQDEQITYFTTSASCDNQSGSWQLPVHGLIFEAERDSLWRQGTMAILKEGLGLAPQDNGSQHLKERGWPFLVDNEGGKTVSVRISGKVHTLSPSGSNGHFYHEVRLEQQGLPCNGDKRWLSFTTLMPEGDTRQFSGEVQLLGTHGVSVVSDIDDTIKLSNVLDKEELLANTFLRDFRAIPGMGQLYRHWKERGAAFHYVTGSPWQLYTALSKFLNTSGFPRGSFAMRHFRLKDASFIDFLSSAEEFKLDTLSKLLQRYPERRFIFVGDSGEKDPEVYGAIARRFPEQVVAIYIRNVNAEAADTPRMKTAFADIPLTRWRLFTRPGELSLGQDSDMHQPNDNTLKKEK